MRRFLIAGNWKMNAGPTEAKKLADEIAETWNGKSPKSEVLICPPFVSIPFVVKSFRDTALKTGAQNVHSESNGAFTGEISTEMLQELTCEYVITGHSERREFFGETDAVVAAKTKRVVTNELKAIVCVGEKLEERKNDSHRDVVKFQLEAVINSIDNEYASDLVIAYEPVWAIGTGRTATPEDAQGVIGFIRGLLAEKWDTADSVAILYGGSVKPDNIDSLMAQPDIDGVLVGGASLQPQGFARIVKYE